MQVAVEHKAQVELVVVEQQVQLEPQTLVVEVEQLVLLQELLMALRANDADGYKVWLTLGIEELGRDVAAEVESAWTVPLLVEEERDRLMAWQLGVSL